MGDVVNLISAFLSGVAVGINIIVLWPTSNRRPTSTKIDK